MLKNFILKLYSLLVIIFLTACAPTSIVQQPTSARPQAQPAAPANNGAIFQTSNYRPLFEDRRARFVGDILTIVITENTTATKEVSSSGNKSGSTSSTVNNAKVLGVSLFPLTDTQITGSTKNAYSDQDKGSSNNRFTGTITVTVTEVLANGNLKVSGEKQVALDKGTEFVRFSGVINPDTIVGNKVSSTQVADVRAEYRSNGRIDTASFLAGLARFFQSFAPF